MLERRIADLLSLRWSMALARHPVDVLVMGGSREYQLQQRPTALPRVRLVAGWDRVSDQPAALAGVIGSPAADTAFVEPVALIDGRGASIAAPVAQAGAAAGEVEHVEFSLNRIVADAHASSPNLMVIGDTWYPGWSATVDGTPAPIFRVNTMFRGVLVPAGAHRIELRFRPTGLRAAALVSAAAAVLMIVAASVRSGRGGRRMRVIPEQL